MPKQMISSARSARTDLASFPMKFLKYSLWRSSSSLSLMRLGKNRRENQGLSSIQLLTNYFFCYFNTATWSISSFPPECEAETELARMFFLLRRDVTTLNSCWPEISFILFMQTEMGPLNTLNWLAMHGSGDLGWTNNQLLPSAMFE